MFMLMGRGGYNPLPHVFSLLCHLSVFITVLQNRSAELCYLCRPVGCVAMRVNVREAAIAMCLREAAEHRIPMAL